MALVQYRAEFVIEHLFSFTYLSRSLCGNKRHEPQCVLQPHLYFMLNKQSNFINEQQQLGGDVHSYSSVTGVIIHAGPVLGLSHAADLTTARFLHLRVPLCPASTF